MLTMIAFTPTQTGRSGQRMSLVVMVKPVAQSQSPAVPHISLEKLQEDFKLARLEIRSAGSQRASCATPRPRCVSARGLLRCQTPRHDPEAMNQHRFLAVGSKVLPKRGARSEEAPPSRRELWGGHRWTPLTARDGRAR
mmetsp:Transcript_35679/g.111637  ORF Transcript_35679/g.111637 Transcript_35679/m.111637 type:complete len:139 (-) Transcript_35679:349-765(-)